MSKTDKFEWTAEQRDALDGIQNWKESCGEEEFDGYDDNQIFRLFGYAGTGKTTVIQEIARRTNGAVLYCAFTGKAASVMRKNGCTGAVTIHSAIYKPLSELIQEAKKLRTWLEDRPKIIAPEAALTMERLAKEQWDTADPRKLQERLVALRDRIEAGPQWILRDKIKEEPKLIITDEVSMVNEDLGRDLLSFGIPTIAIGDPGQLPPVRGAGFFINAEPDAMLREVHRFALENPITRIATTVRMDGARELRLGTYGESRYLSQAIVDSTDMLVEADQVLCGMHKTRRVVNAAIREALGYFGNIPMPGEKLLCCHNSKRHRLLNGTMWRSPELRTSIRRLCNGWRRSGRSRQRNGADFYFVAALPDILLLQRHSIGRLCWLRWVRLLSPVPSRPVRKRCLRRAMDRSRKRG